MAQLRKGTGPRPVPKNFKQQFEEAHPRNITVTTSRYIGRDDKGQPIYYVVYRINPSTSPGWRGQNRKVSPGAKPIYKQETVTFSGGKIGVPRLQKGIDSSSGDGDSRLVPAKDAWNTWITENTGVILTTNDALGLKKLVNEWDGSGAALDKHMRFVSQQFPVGPGSVVMQQQDQDFFDFGFGGGGGGGFSPPVYKAPDRRVIEDMAKGMFVSLTGTIPEHLIDQAVNIYMADHRRNWDSESQEIVPEQSMIEFIRGTGEYQAIHQLRPDSEDERSWISSRRSAAAQGGLQTDLQEDFAIMQATVGGDLPDVADAAAAAQVQESGSARGTLIENKIRNVATNMFRGGLR